MCDLQVSMKIVSGASQYKLCFTALENYWEVDMDYDQLRALKRYLKGENIRMISPFANASVFSSITVDNLKQLENWVSELLNYENFMNYPAKIQSELSNRFTPPGQLNVNLYQFKFDYEKAKAEKALNTGKEGAEEPIQSAPIEAHLDAACAAIRATLASNADVIEEVVIVEDEKSTSVDGSPSKPSTDSTEGESAYTLADNALEVDNLDAESKHEVGDINDANDNKGYESEMDETVENNETTQKNTLYSGWLVKQGHMRQNWKQRYCAVTSSKQLVYYRNQQCTTIKGRINIADYGLTVGNNAFALYKSSKSKQGHACYYFVAEDALALKEWCNSLTLNGIDKNYQKNGAKDANNGWYPGKFLGRSNPNSRSFHGNAMEQEQNNTLFLRLPGRMHNEKDDFKVKIINSSKYELIAVLTSDLNGKEIRMLSTRVDSINPDIRHQMLYVAATKQIAIHTTVVENFLTIIYKLANGDYVIVRDNRPIPNGTSWEAFDYMFVQPNMPVVKADYINKYL